MEVIHRILGYLAVVVVVIGIVWSFVMTRRPLFGRARFHRFKTLVVALLAGAPPYDPTLAAVDASYFFSLYPYYGYQGYMGFLPMTTGYPYVVDDKTPTGERGG